MYELTAIDPKPFKGTVSGVTPEGVEFSGKYCGVATKAGQLFLTLGGVPAEAGGTKGKGWLDIALDDIASHSFAMTEKAGGFGFDHTWTARG